MKAMVSQIIFQLLVALNLFGLTVQLRIRPVAATGNGKRSQPSRSGLYDPDSIERQWIYNKLTNRQKVDILDSRNTWDLPRRWRPENLPKRDGGYMASSIVTRKNRDDVERDAERDVGDVFGLRQNIMDDEAFSDVDGQQLNVMSQLDGPSEYNGEPSIYRTTPLLKSLLVLKLRERQRAARENPFRNTEFEDE